MTVRAISFPPSQGLGMAFLVPSAGPEAPLVRDEWADMFGQLQASVVSAVAG